MCEEVAVSSDHLQKVTDAAQSTDFLLLPEPPAELVKALASAVNSGVALTEVAAAADLPALAVLDAIDAQTTTDPK